MYCGMNQIKIVPIFDQTAPGVWDDFLRISAAAMEFNYNYEMSSQERQLHYPNINLNIVVHHIISHLAHTIIPKWLVLFMVMGRGVLRQSKCLYVLPDYQKHHIGHNLLMTAERVIAPAYKNIELVSLGLAEKFYQRHKYTTKYGTNIYIKHIDNPHCYDVHLFGFPARVKRMCSNLFPDLDVSVFIVPNTPMFAHFDVNGNIDGMAIGTAQSNRAMLLRAKDNWTQKYLSRTFNNYKQFVSALNTGHIK
jgi:GNAT superfamily N-acetyltransferase